MRLSAEAERFRSAFLPISSVLGEALDGLDAGAVEVGTLERRAYLRDLTGASVKLTPALLVSGFSASNGLAPNRSGALPWRDLMTSRYLLKLSAS